VELRDYTAGEEVEQVVVGRPGLGDVVLDFDDDGVLIGLEILGAGLLAPPELLADAEEI
jgi:uncharacterized protein YuzE